MYSLYNCTSKKAIKAIYCSLRNTLPPHLIVREHHDVTSVKVIVMLDGVGGGLQTLLMLKGLL